MNTALLDQFMLWNGSLNTACCLLQYNDNNSFSVVAANTALNELLKNTVDFSSLKNFSGITHYLKNVLESNKIEEWTDYNDNLIAVRLRVKKKVQNLNAMWYKEFAKNFATQGDFGHESP